jgi:hypothetical protein
VLSEKDSPDRKELDALVEDGSWETRLKKWKEFQTSRGSIKTESERMAEIWSSGIASILALLQTDIDVERIQELVEKKLIDGSKRVAGLVLLTELIKCTPD